MDLWTDDSIFGRILNSFSGSSTPPAATPAVPPAAPIDLNNPSAELLRQAKLLFGAPDAQLPDYIKANPESFKTGPGMGNPYQPASDKGLGDAVSKLAALGGSGAAGQTPFGPAKPTLAGGQPYAPPTVPNLPHGASGPVAGGVGPVNPMTMMTAMRGPGNFPLGPAALNPFMLSILKSRLGVS